ncbi:MAG: regulatory protein RecX [Clostridia bacterium]|nr:regulatory protein RecX [Clostridia bacterium]
MRYNKKPIDVTYDMAKEKALRLLEFRSHSEGELKQKLRIYGAKTEDIENVIEFLKEYRLIDDLVYAKHLADDLHNIKKFGKYRIAQELSSKGISREFIDIVLLGLDDNDREQLYPQMEKKLSGDFSDKSRDRAFRYFAMRGYSFDDIKSTFNELKEVNEE